MKNRNKIEIPNKVEHCEHLKKTQTHFENVSFLKKSGKIFILKHENFFLKLQTFLKLFNKFGNSKQI